jgi:hypothetical protein
LDALADLNAHRRAAVGDPEIHTRIAQYEMAWRMQTSVPELADLSREPRSVLERYGAEPGKKSFANNCLLARRLLERDVRFVQLYHWGWDSHGTGPSDDLMTSLPQRCRETDQASAALLEDLAQSGLLDDTLFIWGGEFGRTPMNEERDGSKFLGRDHHPVARRLARVPQDELAVVADAAEDVGVVLVPRDVLDDALVRDVDGLGLERLVGFCCCFARFALRAGG